MKQYDALIARGEKDTLDLIVAIGGTLPVTGILEEHSSVVLYFDEGVFSEDLIQSIREMLPNGMSAEFEQTQVEEQNWNAEFEQSLEPVRITDSLVITQSWHPIEAGEGETVVIIDPKMSFGTGHHESTRLISRLMMRSGLAGRHVLDVGTGTGALAIIAAQQGAERIIAFDNNEWAVENTKENLATNGVADQVEVFQGELKDLSTTGFDRILTNLHRNLIIRLLPELIGKLNNADSTLLTSGVLIEDYQSLLDAAEAHGLVPIDEERENEWVATVFERKR